MIRYLVTGGCGFIGTHLVKALVEKGYSVRILDDLSTSKMPSLPSAVELLVGSIGEGPTIQKALEGVAGCFHLAAVASVQQSMQAWSSSTEVNLMGSVKLFEAIAKLHSPIPLIYASSAAVYGSCPRLPLKEEETLSPLSPYGVDKMACEFHARMGWLTHNMASIGFRLFNVYGPQETVTSPSSNVISLFTQKIYHNEKITIFGDGRQCRDFIYVGDVVRMMVEAMEQKFEGAEVYNLCTGSGVSIAEIADLLETITGREVERQFSPFREGDIYFSIGDPSKAENALGLKTRFPLKKGLEATVKSCKNV